MITKVTTFYFLQSLGTSPKGILHIHNKYFLQYYSSKSKICLHDHYFYILILRWPFITRENFTNSTLIFYNQSLARPLFTKKDYTVQKLDLILWQFLHHLIEQIYAIIIVWNIWWYWKLIRDVRVICYKWFSPKVSECFEWRN